MDDNGRYNLLHPRFGPPQAAFAPLPCPEITGAEGGIDINRKDGRRIGFNQIQAVCVYMDMNLSVHRFKFMFFVKGVKRPFLVDAEKIRFRNFPGAAGEGLFASLRGFIALLLRENPQICLDTMTAGFMQGGRPQEISSGSEYLATALGKVLGKKGTKTVSQVTGHKDGFDSPEKRIEQ